MILKSFICGSAIAFTMLTHQAGAQSLNAQDRKFMEDTAKGGMMEVNMGNLASEQGVSPAVKSFGQRMVQDHSKGNDELKALAKRKGVTLQGDNAPVPSKLTSKTGKDFDNEYSRMMVEDHQKDIKEFEQEVKLGSDPDVKEWANKTLTTLRAHLDAAKSIQPVN